MHLAIIVALISLSRRLIAAQTGRTHHRRAVPVNSLCPELQHIAPAWVARVCEWQGGAFTEQWSDLCLYPFFLEADGLLHTWPIGETRSETLTNAVRLYGHVMPRLESEGSSTSGMPIFWNYVRLPVEDSRVTQMWRQCPRGYLCSQVIDRDLDLHIVCERNPADQVYLSPGQPERLVPVDHTYRAWHRVLDGDLVALQGDEADSDSGESSSDDSSDFNAATRHSP